jgi:drug/metabolite transporter (DMT)-like permease
MVGILYITKVIYILNPDIQVFEVTLLKSFVSIIALAAIFNVQLKHIMYTSVDKSRDALIALVFKTC